MKLTPPNPSGRCQCGCGRHTNRARQTDTKAGNVRGEYLRFVRGHQAWPSLEERFWAKVNKGPECWEWFAAADEHGYGRFAPSEGITKLAHRVSYELNIGPIPDGLNVCHACDNPKCVRPEHLFPGTQLDNIHDMFAKGRQGVGKLTEKQVAEIRSLCLQGWRKDDIAAAYGVDETSVYNIKNGRTHGRAVAA